MAEEAQYSSGADYSAAKRKYDDSTTPPPPSSGRRATGFSAPIIPSQSPDSAPAYNSVPPPVDEIELAKQRAQEIAARLFNSAEAKRPKFENGGGGGGYDSNDNKGFSSGPTDYGQKAYSTNSASAYGGYGSPSKKIDIPNGRVGVIIGKGGETIKYLQLQSGAKIQVTRDMDADPHSQTRTVELTGSSDSIAKAEQLIKDVLAEAESGGSGIVSRRMPGESGGAEQFSMKVPNNKVGLIIGKGGETIKTMQANTGARIQVIPLHLPPGDTSQERTVQIDGSSDQIEAAKQLVNEVISENRPRNNAGSGGYSQQGYQARPQTNWAPPAPQMQQQQGYGYMQQGAGGYPGQPAQYSQPQYGSYPRSGGYAASWDQSGQQTAPGSTAATGGYDYYSQQQTQPPGGTGTGTTTTDSSTYAYSQQGYGYGSQYAQQGYDQQGYANPTAGYGSETTEGQSGAYGSQGDTPATTTTPASGAPPSGYAQPPAGAAYASYGAQPPSAYGYGQKAAPAYGQSPSAAPQTGGYAQPGAYYGGYGQPPYGGQPAAAAYGGGAYGGGYPQQPPAYSGEAAAPATQASGAAVAKASPQ